MQNVEFADTHIKTAACTGRLIKYTCQQVEEEGSEGLEEEEEETRQRDTYFADAWFGSVDSCLIAAQHKTDLVCVVKTVHNRYPKKWIEQAMEIQIQ